MSLKVFSPLAPVVQTVAGIVSTDGREVGKKKLSRSPRSGGSRLASLRPANEDGGTHIPPSSYTRRHGGWSRALTILLRGNVTIAAVDLDRSACDLRREAELS